MASQTLCLIVDDDEITRLVNRKTLNEIFNNIKEAENGLEALICIDNAGTRPVVVILDLDMPIMNGYKVIDSIAANQAYYSNVNIIVVSANNASAFTSSSYYNKVFAFVEKPVNKTQLKNVCMQLLHASIQTAKA